MNDLFDQLRDSIEAHVIAPPFEQIRRRRARKSRLAAVVASAAAVTAIVVGAAVVTEPHEGQPMEIGVAGAASASSASASVTAPPDASSADGGIDERTRRARARADAEQQDAQRARRAGRLAETAPRLLLTAPGWTVSRIDESNPSDGEMAFVNGGRTFDLMWRAASTHKSYVDDRARGAGFPGTISIAGREGVLFLYRDSPNDYTAMWLDGDRSLELRGQAPEAEFRAVAATLKRVDETVWLAALPKSAVPGDERAAVIAEMRVGIPTPPGFDETRLAGTGVADRYQLGALVAGQLVCGWLDQWVESDKAGDADRKAQAAVALAGSKTWPILTELATSGGYPAVLWQYADDVAANAASTFGRDRIRSREYVTGLGCNRT